uniref:Uncharacterized protein n=1 Tax=Arundo donax TaxID=35708 RepID=A0A0A9GMX4_ARUDO
MATTVVKHTNADRHVRRNTLSAKGPTRSSRVMKALSGHAAVARRSTKAKMGWQKTW